MPPMTSTTASETPTCDKVRDPLRDTEFEGKMLWNCSKPPGHDNRGAHLMVDAQGRKTYWRGADND